MAQQNSYHTVAHTYIYPNNILPTTSIAHPPKHVGREPNLNEQLHTTVAKITI